MPKITNIRFGEVINKTEAGLDDISMKLFPDINLTEGRLGEHEGKLTITNKISFDGM
jgi:hypothetical protein